MELLCSDNTESQMICIWVRALFTSSSQSCFLTKDLVLISFYATLFQLELKLSASELFKDKKVCYVESIPVPFVSNRLGVAFALYYFGGVMDLVQKLRLLISIN